uniref:Ig-like domain-containing protein n=1 Tax=Xiphophorus maculatus TaxID=8083 RepID=A0A3B5Q784_XIPMA
MVPAALIKLSAALLWLGADQSKNSVDQIPAALIKEPGESVQINCNHSNTNFYMIQWYKQPPGKTDMTLLGYARYSTQTVEDQFQNLYNVTGSGQSLSSLVIPKLRQSEDSAVYFCAASDAQYCMKPQAPTKTLTDTRGAIIHLLMAARDTGKPQRRD